jgi:hypothetical protein
VTPGLRFERTMLGPLRAAAKRAGCKRRRVTATASPSAPPGRRSDAVLGLAADDAAGVDGRGAAIGRRSGRPTIAGGAAARRRQGPKA